MIEKYGFWHLEQDGWFRSYDSLRYDDNVHKWVTRSNCPSDYHMCDTHVPCGSLRAAKRHLRKHDEIPKGTRFRLVSKYIGFDIYLTKK